MKNNQSGQILLETCATLPLQLLLIAIIFAASFWAFAVALINVEAHSIARSSLYGTPRMCTPSPEWPSLKGLRLEYSCDSWASVAAHLRLFELLDYKTEVTLR
jgi:hypothetical protein